MLVPIGLIALSAGCKSLYIVSSSYNNYYIDVDAATLTPNLGGLCPGQDVVLTCSTTSSITEGQMNWFYNGMTLDTAGFTLTTGPVDTIRDVMVSGFMFSLELTSSMPEFASTLSFRADAAMNGGSVSCRVLVTLSGGGRDTQEPSQILRIIAGKCCDIMVKCIVDSYVGTISIVIDN